MDAVAEIKSRLSIEDVVGEYVQLKRAGKNFKGLSPFTNERTPSFVVSPEKQIWHDFSSGKGGDMFSFVEQVEGADFKTVLELLARKAGVELEQYRSGTSGKGPSKERMLDALTKARDFYQHQLASNQFAKDYIYTKRQFSDKTVRSFELGYSPEQPRVLTDHLLKQGFTQAELKTAGLSVERQRGLTDMFRGRIMVPLHDSFGRVVGFTARLLKDVQGAPKYINTPATPLYDKSRHIYGLHLAKKAIQAQKVAVLVEGNLDVIASHQAGVEHVVATAGTALTEMQLKALGRFTPDIRLAFDQDRAGVEAAERAIPIAGKVKVDLSIVTIPSGKDPDELIKQDPNLWTKAIVDAEPALDWVLRMYQERLNVSTASGKRQFSDVALAIVRLLPDAVEQDHYIQRIAKITEVHTDSLRQKLATGSSPEIKQKTPRALAESPKVAEGSKLQSHYLALMLMIPNARVYLDLVSPVMFVEPEAQGLLEFLQDKRDFSGDLSDPELQPLTDYVKVLSLQFEELYGTIDPTELHYEAARLRAAVVDNFVKKQKQIIIKKLKENPNDTSLLSNASKLDQLLRRTRV
jgi:DNA primase